MAVESATYVSELVDTNPPSSDNVSQGDDHIRLIKDVLQNTFPSASGVYTALVHDWTAVQTFTGTGSLAAPVELISTNGDENVGPILSLYRNSSSVVDGDIGGAVYFYGEDSVGNKDLFAAIEAVHTDITSTTEDGTLQLGVVTAGSFAYELALDGSAIFPVTGNGLALGKATKTFSDLFLADGAFIDFSNGDVTIEHSSGVLTFASVGTGYVFDKLLEADDLTVTGTLTVEGTAVTAAVASIWDASTLAIYANSVLNALGSEQAGAMLWYNGSSWAVLPPGTNGQHLEMGLGGFISWQD